MKISSTAFKPDEMIPEKYTCEGDNINPPLQIAEPPAETESLALILHDPDAPGGDFVHWILWNIDPSVLEIEEGTIPVGAQEGMNDSGQVGYTGPCPPSGTHHYEFHLYALDTMIDLPETSDKTDLRNEIEGHILDEASLIGLYKKSSS